MSNLRIFKAMSLHPSANIKAESQPEPSSRMCLMGCEASATELRRFPIHDVIRCNYWLRHFGVSEQLVNELGGLKKLRICCRHFSQRKAMAKTRIKTTPLRGSKHIIPATTTATTTAAATSAKPMADSTTIELVDSSSGDSQKQQTMQEKSVTTITPLPQRSHSICSSSSVSSDVQSISSDYEASMPLSALVNAQNGTGKSANGVAKKRKLYLITEKSDEKNGNSGVNGQKRKMFVVVEQEKDTAAKKLMIVTDKSKANITEHLEKFLPEILSCIQGKEQAQAKAKHPAIKQEPTPTPIAHKPHITLPPKKNPTNFIKVEGAPGVALPASVSILPVDSEPIKPPSLSSPSPSPPETETNINLSPDFRFLMKILPKLEQLPEPHKQHVKRSIQIFVEESYSHYGKKD
ncbi:uncharacterized protein LOC117570497 isoform X1 [Drosophila albomicans]|uniref:Uncharacterized protein LOC117570497 isoform X1 n=2 Tax=Drosophila albomicans TaxID=7291 RepID=A0A6P8YPB6_DROAB|nr:uncharacterized protein LOC117570497 isoform X1 [Drosophila albomicans]